MYILPPAMRIRRMSASARSGVRLLYNKWHAKRHAIGGGD